jgi:hypothetical protein
MNWQDDYQIDGGRRVGGRIASAVFIIVLITAAAALPRKDDAQAVSDKSTERGKAKQ